MSFLIILKDYLQIIKINYLDNMAIIRYTKDATIRYAYLNIFPDQFKTDKEKENEQPVSDTDQKNKKDSVSKESKTRPGFHMMLFVDSKNGMIKQMGIGQAAIEIILTCVIALIIVLAAGWGVSASHAHTMENEVKELDKLLDTISMSEVFGGTKRD